MRELEAQHGNRTWTNDDLRAAVATSNSWRGVLRSLDLKEMSSSSRRTVQKHTAALGIDTSHFTRGRRWSQEQLIEAVNGASSWQELGDMLGVKAGASMRTLIKGHAARLGLCLDHLSTAERGNNSSRPSLACIPYQPSELRRAAPAIAIAWFLGRGLAASLPVEPEPYDLLVGTPEGIKRVQVKSSSHRNHAGHWMTKVGHGSSGKRRTEGVTPYDHEIIDLFFAVDGDLDLYLIPSLTLAGRIYVAINTYQDFRVGNASGLFTTS